MSRIQNPVLRGFHPDPSITKAGDSYYIAVSTFEWYPGVLIYSSKNLAQWELAAAPLNRPSLLDMRGNQASGGIWAPCLSYDDGMFYLIFTDMKNWKNRPFRDAHNYLTTSPEITGPWSEPVYLNSSGFDPSLFHDDDGRRYLLNMKWNYLPGKNSFDGIVIQEYDSQGKRLTGAITNIFKGTDLGLTEAPHLYKRGGWYYLITAEGGTSYKHAVTMARSKSITGPYEIHPANPILTSWNNPELTLQKAGHGSFVEGPGGFWYMAHLCSRPMPAEMTMAALKEKGKNIHGNRILGVCPLGRETALQKFSWAEDGWLYHESGTNEPDECMEIPSSPAAQTVSPPPRMFIDSFDSPALPLHYQSLRIPMDSFISLEERKGFLRLYGRESISSQFCQAIIARRIQDFRCTVETAMEYRPDDIQQMAGLIIRYDENNQYYLRVTYNEETQSRTLGIIMFDDGCFSMPLGKEEQIIPDSTEQIYLKAEIEYEDLHFSCSWDGEEYLPLKGRYNAGILSDEYAEPLGFTGAFAGMACNDMSGRMLHSDFSFFRYIEHTGT